MSQFVLFVFFSVFLTTSAKAESQLHRVYGLNLETVSNCESMIDSIAAEIERKHAVTVAASFCETSSVTNLTVGVISYVANEQLQEVSTYTFDATYAAKGIYQTKELCEAMLQRDILIFQANTGLSMTYAFCSKEYSQYRNAWFPNITAFGIAKKVPHRSFWHSGTPHGTDLNQIRSTLGQHFYERGAEFIHLTYREMGSSGKVSAFYYIGLEDLPLEIYDDIVATIPGLEACRETVSRIQADGVVIDGKPLILSYCSSGYTSPSRFELILLHESGSYLDSFLHSEKFSSLELCELSRPAIERELRTVYGSKLVTTVCGHKRFSLTNSAPYSVVAVRHY
jgi:hypothetical protein